MALTAIAGSCDNGTLPDHLQDRRRSDHPRHQD